MKEKELSKSSKKKYGKSATRIRYNNLNHNSGINYHSIIGELENNREILSKASILLRRLTKIKGRKPHEIINRKHKSIKSRFIVY